MDKVKIALIAAVVVLGIICIAMGRNAGVLKSQVNSEKAKVTGLNAQIQGLEAQMAEANKQVGMVNDLQDSLNAARQQVVQANQQISALMSQKSDLETRLEAAINALQPPSEPEKATSAAE